MKTSQEGINFIKKHEGLRLAAYLDSTGTPTIGYGHTGGVKLGDVITEQQAEQYLRQDVIIAENEINRQQLPLNQNQFDALVSFVFNVGVGRPRSHPRGPSGFLGSTLLAKAKIDVNNPSIADEFRRWVYSKGRVLPGLVKRRKEEAELYFKK